MQGQRLSPLLLLREPTRLALRSAELQGVSGQRFRVLQDVSGTGYAELLGLQRHGADEAVPAGHFGDAQPHADEHRGERRTDQGVPGAAAGHADLPVGLGEGSDRQHQRTSAAGGRSLLRRQREPCGAQPTFAGSGAGEGLRGRASPATTHHLRYPRLHSPLQ